VKTKILFKSYKNFPKESVAFIDLTPSFADPCVRTQILDDLAGLFRDKIDFIVSPDARGFLWGMPVAERLGVGFIPLRKEGKLPKDAIAHTVRYKTEYSETILCLPVGDIGGKRLLFVDDVYATGGTYMAAKQLVSRARGILIGGAVVVDIELDTNSDIRALAKRSELTLYK